MGVIEITIVATFTAFGGPCGSVGGFVVKVSFSGRAMSTDVMRGRRPRALVTCGGFEGGLGKISKLVT